MTLKYVIELVETSFFPSFKYAMLKAEMLLSYAILKHLITQEILNTLVGTLVPALQQSALDTLPHNRLTDCVRTLVLGFGNACYYFLIQTALLPISILLGLFSILETIFWLLLGCTLLCLGLICNILYLAIYNLVLHTGILSLATHTMIALLALIPTLVDHNTSYNRLLLGFEGIKNSFSSLGTLLHALITQPISLLIGYKFLSLSSDPCIEKQSLVLEGFKNHQWPWGIDSNIIQAAKHFGPWIAKPIQNLQNYLVFLFTLPLFLLLRGFQVITLLLSIVVKTVLTPPLCLIRPITSLALPPSKKLNGAIKPLATFAQFKAALSNRP